MKSSALVMIVSICLDFSSLFLRSSESCLSIVRYSSSSNKRATSFDLDFTYCSISSRCVFSFDWIESMSRMARFLQLTSPQR